MPRVVTEFDIDLAKEQAKIAQIKADMKAVELAAKQVKIGDNLVSANASAEIAKIASLKAQIAQTSFESGMRELEPQQQLYAITQRIAQLKADAMSAGPMRESQALQLEAQTMQLAQRRIGILAEMGKEKARLVALDHEEAANAQRLAAIESVRMSASQHRALLGSSGAMGAGGGGGRMQMGMLAQQAQDVAVQMQMGTSPITIIAQQAPQMASIFGPTGMIVGGFVAIGGAAISMGKANKEAFDKLISGAKESEKEITKLATSTSFTEIAGGMEKVAEQTKSLAEARSGLNGLGQTMGGIFGVFVGGDTRTEKLAKLKDAQEQAEKNISRLSSVALNNSERELQIAELKAKGKDFEAGQIERQIQLERELRQIRDSQFAPDVKAQLMNNAEAVAAAKEETEWTKERARREKEIEDSKKKQQAIVLATIKAQSEEDGRVQELQKQIAERGFERSLKGMNNGEQQGLIDAQIKALQDRSHDLGPLQKSEELKIQMQIDALLDRKAELQRQEAEDASKAADAAEKEAKAAKDKIATLAASRRTLAEDMALLQAKASGDDKRVAALEKEIRIHRDAERIAKDNGIDPANARRIAETRDRLQEQADRRKRDAVVHEEQQGRHRIHGARSGGFEGLGKHDFSALDKIREGGAWNWNAPRDLYNRRVMPLRDAQTSQTHREAAARQQQSDARVSMTEAPAMIAVLEKILAKFELAN